MIAPELRRALTEALDGAVHFDTPLSRHTSLGVGGPADALATPVDRAGLARTLSVCRAHRLPHHVLGSGFNTLVRDGGVGGVVVRLSKLRRIEPRPAGGVRAEAGVSHSQVTRFCVQRGLAGLEFAAGIPGTVGGWLAMNAGIPRHEMEARVREIEVMSPTGRRTRHLRRERLHFVYRALRGLAPGSVILSVLFSVAISTPGEVKAEVDRLLARRADTQPLDIPSCGSVFKNPRGDHAGRLIESAGLKGHRIGGAEISTLHANFIVNTGGATAADVLALIEYARRTVLARCGIELEREVRVVGRQP
ncbi:MAG: UDP-N-acetylmuramate dehydrogenase [Myxococcota bacterium]|nr:UDP-N-acetylmuramate dehydrogenase [Myxococcota bacterium]MDP6244109.1 UDP-N-acetylmuramate dehydrogenase [Myxococcota bacterium]MDP7075749.1 UDP-N-acetylmuramate dehydrogenase [Myxococcota bacterium]MDP7299922.1 UDP-N-acetylmuramate dehydrogenase [Myxococcota bacterium]MDP7433798.1 UDP-N-acetylmuramate dehydrogenase [Myxococcota bacterium]